LPRRTSTSNEKFPADNTCPLVVWNEMAGAVGTIWTRMIAAMATWSRLPPAQRERHSFSNGFCSDAQLTKTDFTIGFVVTPPAA